MQYDRLSQQQLSFLLISAIKTYLSVVALSTNEVFSVICTGTPFALNVLHELIYHDAGDTPRGKLGSSDAIQRYSCVHKCMNVRS